MATATLEVKGIRKKSMAALAGKARDLGITPERYVRELLEADLALDRKAKTTPLRELMGPSQRVDEAELDKLVEVARAHHYRRAGRRG